VLGAFAGPPDALLLDTAMVKPKAAKLTSEVVRRALASSSIGPMRERTTDQITFPAPITRDGPGGVRTWSCRTASPPGRSSRRVTSLPPLGREAGPPARLAKHGVVDLFKPQAGAG
jgi:hypothetical protein